MDEIDERMQDVDATFDYDQEKLEHLFSIPDTMYTKEMHERTVSLIEDQLQLILEKINLVQMKVSALIKK